MLSRRAFLGACALPLLGGCSARLSHGKEGEAQSSFFCFDTLCSLGGTMTQEVLDAAVARCQGFEQTLSRTIATSDVGHINAAEGKPVSVSPETARLVDLALGYCEESGGLFDITIGAVSELWDFHEGVVPSDVDIAQALPHVGWQGVEVDLASSIVTLADPHARIDLGGIAKGFVTDVLLGELAEAGVQNAFVNLGGNVGVLGTKADGGSWRIGVRDPFDDSGNKSIAVVEANAGSVVTSGLYERQFEVGGRRYWHILDPRTGYPVKSDVVSASIFSSQSIDGDGYTKPLFMLGHEEGLAFLEKRGLAGLLIGEDGSVQMTANAPFDLL